MKIPIDNYYENEIYELDTFGLFTEKVEKTFTIVITSGNYHIGNDRNETDISIFENDEWIHINEITKKFSQHCSWLANDTDESYVMQDKEYIKGVHFFDHHGFYKSCLDDDARVCTSEEIFDIVYKEFDNVTINKLKTWLSDNKTVIDDYYARFIL